MDKKNFLLKYSSAVGYIFFEINYDRDILETIFVGSVGPMGSNIKIKKRGRVGELISKVRKHLSGSMQSFCFSDLPIDYSLFSENELKVFFCCSQIKCGEVVSYSELAKRALGNEKCARVVGNILKKNPYPIIIPCHRVVSKNSIGGFQGAREGESIFLKKKLLALEGVVY